MVKIIINKSVYLALLACFPVLQVQAEIFKCVNKQGKTFYNDKPCPVFDKETLMKAVKDPKDGYIPPVFVKDNEGKGNTIVTGADASKEFKKSVDEKKGVPKNEYSSPLNGGGSIRAGIAPYAAPVSDSGRVPSSSAKNNNSGGGGKKSSDAAVLPRVELKVEHREY